MTARQILERVKLQQERKIIAYEKRYTRMVRKALVEQVQYAIKNNGEISIEPMQNALSHLYSNVMWDFVRWQYNLLSTKLVVKSEAFFLNTWRVWISLYVQVFLAQRVTNINETTRERIKEAIRIGVDQGLSWEDIAYLIKSKTYEIASVHRAIMIARTETANAANMAKDKSKDDWKEETGETIYKLWIHRFAKEPRGWHSSLDNNVAIPEAESFVVTNPKSGRTEYLLRPHAPNASAENVINCSCEVLYCSERYAKKLMSRK